MPEGDALHRIAQRLQVLVGERVEVETPHPRVQGKRLAEQLDGRELEAVEAVGKNLLLHFAGGVHLRNHLRMHGRWRVGQRGRVANGLPWLVLRSAEHEAALWHGPVLELVRDGASATRRLGPDILGEPLDLDAIVTRFHAADQARELGDALLDQRLVAGIGNVWKAEALWEARVSPWRTLAQTSDDELRATLAAAHTLMRARLGGARRPHRVYRRVGRPCPRCGTPVRSLPQGDAARTTYWCPACQAKGDGAGAA